MRTIRFAVLIVALLILGLMVSIPSSHAKPPQIQWNGSAGDGKWETGGNWVGGNVPGVGDDAVIPDDAFVVTISSSQNVLDLRVGLGDTLICTSTCHLATDESVLNSGTFENFGTVNIESQLSNPGIFINFGTVSITSFFVNDGSFTNRCGGTVSKAPTSGNPVTTALCVVGGEVLSLDYGSLIFSAAPWLLIVATLAAAAAMVLRKKFKLF